MIVDANAYIGRWPYWPVAATSPEQVFASLSESGIQRAAVCSTRSIFVHWEDGNCETEAAQQAIGEALIPFVCFGTRELSHAYREPAYDFESYAARGFRGVRLYPQHHSYHLLFCGFVDVILEDAAARSWPVVLPLRALMNWGVPSLSPEVMHAIVSRHPRVQWILAGVNYLFELQMATSLMLKYPNVSLETSCVMGYAAIEKTVAQCGEDQLLFGSGAPFQMAAASLAKVMQASLADRVKDKILGGNFLRLLGASA
jgi:predicted TIM-barrel fold metal-dependent hydrolase